MKYYLKSPICCALVTVEIFLILVILFCLISRFELPFDDMPEVSAEFNCVDSVKFGFNKLNDWGISSTIMLGNLNKSGEERDEADHVWLIVSFGPLKMPLEVKKFKFEKQYFEGYPITYEELIMYVNNDRK